MTAGSKRRLAPVAGAEVPLDADGDRMTLKMQQPAEREPATRRDPNINMESYGPDVVLTIRLVLIARRWRALLDEQLRKIDQTSARMEAISAILTSPGPNSQADIAKRLRIEGPTMTRMIDTLARDGLVERNASPNDRRTKHLTVTEEGETALEAMLDLAEELRGRLLRGVPAEKIAELNEFFAGLLDRLDAGLPESGEACE